MAPADTQDRPERLARLADLGRGATTEAALALFDALPATPLEVVVGPWRGSGLVTGHPLDGMLEAFGWHGKRFDGPDDVHPLVFERPGGGLFAVSPALIPLGLTVRAAALLKRPTVARALRSLMGALRTRQPGARLRRTEFRGVVTATMIYDAQPIHDVFRMVDQDTLLGVMDMRGLAQPFIFVLRREGDR